MLLTIDIINLAKDKNDELLRQQGITTSKPKSSTKSVHTSVTDVGLKGSANPMRSSKNVLGPRSDEPALNPVQHSPPRIENISPYTTHATRAVTDTLGDATHRSPVSHARQVAQMNASVRAAGVVVEREYAPPSFTASKADKPLQYDKRNYGFPPPNLTAPTIKQADAEVDIAAPSQAQFESDLATSPAKKPENAVLRSAKYIEHVAGTDAVTSSPASSPPRAHTRLFYDEEPEIETIYAEAGNLDDNTSDDSLGHDDLNLSE